MKYAVFSDIHSNLEAFNAALEAMRGERPDRYLCVGDIVGYGADPAECIRKVKELKPVIVTGNHDWASVGLASIEYFNPFAKSAVLWTKENLNRADRGYLKSLTLAYEDDKITLVHGTLDYPEAFSYMFDGYNAARTMALMKTQLCFVGHSHVAGTFYEKEGVAHYSSEQRIEIKPGNKYIVNTGSVGQPRDGDPRGSYCVYDDEKNIVEIKRFAYDIATARRKIADAGLPRALAERLVVGR